MNDLLSQAVPGAGQTDAGSDRHPLAGVTAGQDYVMAPACISDLPRPTAACSVWWLSQPPAPRPAALKLPLRAEERSPSLGS